MTTTLGRLACQRNSFLKELSTTVVSCVRAAKGPSYHVVCQDSVLFPEGGGQPGDLGTLKLQDKVFPVTKTFTANEKCVLETLHEFKAGDQVLMTVDWPRRHDHMQQHSAQHLISAIAENLFKLDTTTWSLGAARCNVEFNSTALTPSQLEELEFAVNEAIAAARPVSVHYKDDTSSVRIVVIDQLDKNPCCGTHVEHLGQLQAVKFLYSEVARGCTRVWFVAGNRVFKEFSAMFERERIMTKLWSCRPEEHAERLQKVLQAQSSAAKEQKVLRLELAALLAKQLQQTSSGYAILHREDADLPFLQSIAAAYNDLRSGKVLVLTSGDKKSGEGAVVISGPEAFVNENAKQIVNLLDGKGGGLKGLFQGKVNKLGNLDAVVAHLDSLKL
ncbi:alanyl-tRNA synthetase domain-containing protein 1 [Thraustotheca clavata]|uniref:Alanyl-tRNA synthetase domain-containing protein 1 n=1 Tax=Thraustotheca clavata TaxID=74557 RepID=A0A1V9ZC62_9STRA|nr:alanyl-tRNA synthetase domain-containing protein 1 [Thraustotheca clavata]